MRASVLTRDGVAGCALVIESVPEDRALKIEVLSQIEAAAPNAIVATNTSGLTIAGLAATLRAPERFLGLHFFSPAERMPLVEVVKGPETAETTIAAALAFLEAVGKRPVLVRDGPGFFATRVFAAYLDEGVAMLVEGVAPTLIEEAALANGRTLGPLAMLDETGIGLNLQQARQARADGLGAALLPAPRGACACASSGIGPWRSSRGRRLLRLACGWRSERRGRSSPQPSLSLRGNPILRPSNCACSSRKRGKRSAASKRAGSPAPTTQTRPPFSGSASPRESGAFCVGWRTSA